MTNSLFALIEAWIKSVLSDITEVIQRTQVSADAPRPEKPYAVVHLRQHAPMSATPYVFCSDTVDPEVAANVLQHHSWKRNDTLVVDIFDEYSMEKVSELELSLHYPSNLELFKAADVALTPVGTALDTTELRDTSHDPSAQVEFIVQQIQQGDEGTPWIETINVEIDTDGS